MQLGIRNVVMSSKKAVILGYDAVSSLGTDLEPNGSVPSLEIAE